MRWLTDIVFVGMAGLLFAASDWLVALLFDERYAPVAPMLRLLSFGLLLSRYNLLPKVYVALGRPDFEAIVNVIKVISLFVLMPASYLSFGTEGAILASALYMTPAVGWMLWFNRKNGLNNVWLELTTLWMWPVGWLFGSAIVAVFVCSRC
jgi:O-antigen/teichoic acid export membrane protein